MASEAKRLRQTHRYPSISNGQLFEETAPLSEEELIALSKEYAARKLERLKSFEAVAEQILKESERYRAAYTAESNVQSSPRRKAGKSSAVLSISDPSVIGWFPAGVFVDAQSRREQKAIEAEEVLFDLEDKLVMEELRQQLGHRPKTISQAYKRRQYAILGHYRKEGSRPRSNVPNKVRHISLQSELFLDMARTKRMVAGLDSYLRRNYGYYCGLDFSEALVEGYLSVKGIPFAERNFNSFVGVVKKYFPNSAEPSKLKEITNSSQDYSIGVLCVLLELASQSHAPVKASENGDGSKQQYFRRSLPHHPVPEHSFSANGGSYKIRNVPVTPVRMTTGPLGLPGI